MNINEFFATTQDLNALLDQLPVISLDGLPILLAGSDNDVVAGGLRDNSCTLDGYFASLDAVGQVSVTLDFENHPNVSFVLISYSPFPSRYKDGAIKHSIYGSQYRLNSATESIDPKSGKRTLAVNLEGWNRHLCEKKVNFYPDYKKFYYTLSKVASEVGVSVSGGTSTRLTIDSMEPISTTLTDALNAVATQLGRFVSYDKQSVTLKTLNGSGGKTVSGRNVVSFDYIHKGSSPDGFVYSPTILDWNKEYYEEQVERERNVLEEKPKFKRVLQNERIIINDPEKAAERPYNAEVKSFDMNYDMSGPTKVSETNTFYGSVLKTKKIDIYGLAYNALTVNEDDVVTSYNDSWQLVETFTIEFNYSDKGYYLGYKKNGYKYVRFWQESESENLAIINKLLTETTDDEEKKILYEKQRLYTWFWTPILEYENLKLRAFFDYYPDATPTVDEVYFPYKEYNQGKITTAYVLNETFVLPMFVEEHVLHSNSHAWTPLSAALQEEGNPEFAETGEVKKQIKTVKIEPSKNTWYSSSQNEDMYTETEEIYTSQDPRYGSSYLETNSTSNEGRPSVADFSPVYELDIEQTTIKSKVNPDRFKTYISYSNNYKGNKIPGDTVTFPFANSLSEAKEALKNLVEKEALFAGDEFTVTMLADFTINPGEKLTVSYKGGQYSGIVRTVNHNIEILGKGKAKGYTIVTCGVQNNKNKVSMKTELYQSDNKPGLFLPRPNILVGDFTQLFPTQRGVF